MTTILTAITIAQKLKQCYDQRVKLLDFKGDDDTCVQILREWMPNYKGNAVEAALECIKAWQANNPGSDDGIVIHGFCAAAYYLTEVAPPGHHGPRFTTHDTIMLDALRHVNFGHFNNGQGFVTNVKLSSVRTDRQRWWLTTLVVRHRKQIPNRAAVATAEAWLKANPEPQQPAKEAAPTAPPQPQGATEAEQPTLF